jgi:tetratricopeptide (TPR) repeat protein
MWQTYELFMQQCDGVVVTGPGLAQLFSDKTDRPIHVIENHLPEPLGAFESVWNSPDDTINIGWAGSVGHISDLMAIAPVLRELLSSDSRYMLHIMGNKTIPKLLDVPEGRLRFTNWGTMQQYYDFWKPVQIGFVPMIDTPFNQCRSDVKAIEMSACGVLPILPDVLPYQEFLNRTNAPSYGSFSRLKALISEYADNPNRLESYARRCFDYVKHQRIGINRTERMRLFFALMSSSSGEFEWPLPAGYNEVTGTPYAKPSHGAVLEKAKAAQMQGRTTKALAVLTDALERNPLDSEVAFMESNMLADTGNATAGRKIDQYRERFPLDLRFSFLRTRMSTTPDECLENWNNMIRTLSSGSVCYKDYFQANMVKLYYSQLPNRPELISISEQLLEIFPDSALLHLAVAQAQVRTQNYLEAAGHFEWLLEARRKCLPNHEFFSKLPLKDLQSWSDALRAYVDNG